ncbi:conserved hypothetical protein [Methylobacterium sp. 4-46]|uniref:DUF6460 domain-containing protein n=1 Tax=unclassified Methylobacterium TaxID=2615210 RepID=UPI000165CAC4|nr:MULTISPECIES: DUF6460 domain-containing protein [Methylobacterium]ACA17665.1 conserved hypothetical protein [Methylobacterium sp. 4-46]WFT83335.1 DUF6460 domain-containing protein [Methylobacterium nodulans]
MSDPRFTIPPGRPHDPRGGQDPRGAYDGSGAHRAGSDLRRFLGGSPAAVLVRLVFLSLLVGAGMAMIGITPRALYVHAYDTLRTLIDLGLSTFHDAGTWLIAGAVVVVPLWLLSRLLAGGR